MYPPIHLSLVISSLSFGGAERILSDLANHWVSQNYQVSLITLTPPESKPFYFLDPKINLIQLNQAGSKPFFISRLGNILRRVLCLRQTLKKIDPDLIISFIDIMNITTLLAGLGLKKPIIVSERTDPKSHRLPYFYQQLRKFIYKKAAHVVVQTSTAANFFKNLNNVNIIPNAVLIPSITKKIDNSAVTQIVSIGRLYSQKNFATLIIAFAILAKSFPNLKLTIYGEGQERTNLEHLIKKLNLKDRVFLPGVTNDTQKVLATADLFIFPSQYEGFPNALCEAMACGLPVIASNCSGNIEIVHDRMNGRLFPIGDIATLTNITLELIQDDKQRFCLAANAKNICDTFSATRIYSLWDQLIVGCNTKRTS